MIKLGNSHNTQNYSNGPNNVRKRKKLLHNKITISFYIYDNYTNL